MSRLMSGRCRSILLTMLASFAVSACTVPFPVYSISGENVEIVRSIPAKIKVKQFTGPQSEVTCRLQPIGPEGGKTFAAFISKAFADDVSIAGSISEKSIEINGVLKHVDVSCGIANGSWVIEMEISVDDQPPFTVRTVRKFDGNFAGAVVAMRAYQAFNPAVQQFV